MGAQAENNLIIGIITIAFSGGALIVSIISLYYSLFRKRISLVGCLAAWNPRTELQENTQVCDITLSNTGTRELLLREIEVLSSPERDGEIFPALEVEEVPAVIKPGEIRLIKLPIPNFYLGQLAARHQKLKLEFHIYTTDAKLKIASKELTPPINDTTIPQRDWKPFKLR